MTTDPGAKAPPTDGDVSPELVDRVADIIDRTELGYSIALTRLVDGVETWTLEMDGERRDFRSREEASESVARERRRRQAARIIAAVREALPVRPPPGPSDARAQALRRERDILAEELRKLRRRTGAGW